MRKLCTLIGLSLGLFASLAYVLWENRPRRINFAFVAGNSEHSAFLGMPGAMAALVVGLPVLGAVLGLIVGIVISNDRDGS
jgi:ABC-type uncharacterized transport system permease subunit